MAGGPETAGEEPGDSLNREISAPLSGSLKDSGHRASDPLVALHGGDPGPFEAYVASETGRFLGFFARLGASRSEADDLVQETFLKLFRLAAKHADSGSADYAAQGRFDAYAFRVARNVWIDRTRRGAAQPRTAGDDASELPIARDARRASSGATSPVRALETREESDRIRAAVESLGESHRLVFELGVIQELPYAEISAALDIPVGTVKSRMFHAVRKVRDALEGADRSKDRLADRRRGDGDASKGRAS